ncbi:hypothetical protein [Deinococcus navajonensis]|uniref:Uncharacterized protein n=1 Tax=Deinococcus navajonensis TaxID=309884 RepID=A0ABV8XRH5_9DEIO
MTPDPLKIVLSPDRWDAFLASLYERDDRLDLRVPDATYHRDEAVDAYVLSAHAEALRSGEVEGDVWGTLEDLDETAGDEEEAWEKICAFYLERGCVLVRVTDMDEPEEWILSAELAGRLGLMSGPEQESASTPQGA